MKFLGITLTVTYHVTQRIKGWGKLYWTMSSAYPNAPANTPSIYSRSLVNNYIDRLISDRHASGYPDPYTF